MSGTDDEAKPSASPGRPGAPTRKVERDGLDVCVRGGAGGGPIIDPHGQPGDQVHARRRRLDVEQAGGPLAGRVDERGLALIARAGALLPRARQ